jgi:transcriptional regulator with XRE-family HTH domain
MSTVDIVRKSVAPAKALTAANVLRTVQPMANKVAFKRTGAALRRWRVAEKLSMDQAAWRVGVTAPVWSAWETGAKRPAFENALRLEELTDGTVPFEAWCYGPALFDVLRRVVALRDDREEAGESSAVIGG